MPIIKIKGLEGLNGLYDLSEDERKAFFDEHGYKLTKYEGNPMAYSEAASRLYKNRQFIDKFGEDAFNKMNVQERDSFYEESLLNEYAANRYGNDARYDEISRLTAKGKLDLIERGYLSDSELAKEEEDRAKAMQSLSNMPYTGSIPIGPTVGYESALDAKNRAQETKRKDLLDALVGEDNARKRDLVSNESSLIYSNIQSKLDSEEMTKEEVDKMFEDIAGGEFGSRYYKAFKDAEELQHFTTSDKLKMLSNFLAINSKFNGPMSALSNLESEMQNYISDNQSGLDWAGNTIKNIGVGGVAHLMNTIMAGLAIKHAIIGDLDQFLQGKDANGNELDEWNNPLYWQGVDQFNTFDANEIKKARANGGISKYQNITRAGEEMDYLSWHTVNEAAKQTKYLWADAVVGKLTGGLSGALTKSVGKSLRGVTNKIGTLASVLSTGMANAEAEGLGAFQEALQNANALIDERIDNELNSFINDKISSEEGKADLEKLKQNLKKFYSSPEFANSYKSDEAIEAEALEMYKKDLRNSMRDFVSSKYEADRRQAEKSATLAYINTATVSELKTSLTNAAFRKVIFSKNVRDGLRGNNTNFVIDKDGMPVHKPMSKWAKYGKPIFVNPIGEGIDEFFDSVINNYGEGYGMTDFNNYMANVYNPAATDASISFLTNFVGGLDRSLDSFLDKDAYYEGYLGLVSGGANITPNVGGMLDYARMSKEDKSKLTALEKFNSFITNPILQDIADNIAEERGAKNQIETINKVLTEHRKDLEGMTALVSTMGGWDSSVRELNELDAHDEKRAHLFATMNLLNSLGSSEIASQSALYQNAIQTLEELASGNIPEEKLDEYIDTFLGVGENKSVASAPNAREIAKERLIKNAQEMLAIKDEIAEINSIIDDHPDANYISDNVREELAYLKIRKSNWEERLNEITEHLGTTLNNRRSYGIYGSKKGLMTKKESLNKYNEDLSEAIKDAEDEKAEILLRKKSKDREVARKALTEEKAINLKMSALREKQSRAQLELQELESYTESLADSKYTRTLTEEEILGLSPEDRAYMLNESNLGNYSLEQQQIIKNTINNLKAKDPNLIREIKDAAELATRIEGVNGTFAKISDNPLEASEYFDLMREYRNEVMSHLLRNKAQVQVERMFEGKTDDEVKSIAKNLPTIAIEDYIKKHPEKADLLNQIKPIATLREDARNVINKLTEDNGLRTALKTSIVNLTEDAETIEEAINSIEDAIDSDTVDNSTKGYLNNILSELEKLKYQRNATKVKTREDKKKREEELAKSREKETKKKEEAKKEGEKKAEESKAKEKKEETLEEEPVNVGSEETIIEDSLEDVNLDSPSLEAQEKETPNVEIIETPKTSPITAASSSSSVLIGNAMYGYNGLELRNRGIQTSRTGVKPDDNMSRFFNWIKAAGIKLQEIIDNELHAILSKNPKIHFLMVNPNGLATHDDHMQDHVLEVVEYTSDIAKIHNDSYGGVVEANGKKWLIIGTLGFNGNEQGNAYRAIKYELKKRRFKYLNDNPSERFFVDSDYYTEVKEIGAGWIVRQLESDTEVKYRTIQELLDSPERNPRGLKMENLKWGIQQGGKFATIGISHRNKIATPIDIVPNLGNTFLMIESANGKYIPIAIRPTMYTELKRGVLTDEINTLLMELTSPVFKDRLKARKQLATYLYLKDSENTILIGSENSNTLSIKKNGIIIKTFNLNDPSFNSMEYIEAIESLNPRVNITSSTLSSPVTIKKFDEAGALSTDAAKLGTSNADFTVKNIGIDGKPINTNSTPNESPKIENSELTRTRERSFEYQGRRYRRRENEYYTELGELITDPRMLEQLHYSRILQESKMNPVEKTSEYEYFIISEDKNKPIAIKRNINNGSIIVASEEESRKMIQRTADNKAKENANKIVEVGDRMDVSLDEPSNIADELFEGYTEESKEVKDVIEDNSAISEEDDINTTGTKSLAELQNNVSTDTFMDIICSEKYGDRLDTIIDEKISSGKWKNVPDDLEARAKYLQSKGIAITGIRDVESWLNMIEECK